MAPLPRARRAQDAGRLPQGAIPRGPADAHTGPTCSPSKGCKGSSTTSGATPPTRARRHAAVHAHVPGPMDFTPGAMHTPIARTSKSVFNAPMSLGTRSHQLAMVRRLREPAQMLADSPPTTRGAEAMEFLGPVPSVWDETRRARRTLGDYVVVGAGVARPGTWRHDRLDLARAARSTPAFSAAARGRSSPTPIPPTMPAVGANTIGRPGRSPAERRSGSRSPPGEGLAAVFYAVFGAETPSR